MKNRDPERGEPDLDEQLRALAHADARIEAPAHLGDAVLAEWDAQHTSSRSSPPRRRRLWPRQVAALATAAVLVMAWLVAHFVRIGPAGSLSVRGDGGLSRTTLPISEATTNLMVGSPLEAESLQIVRVRMQRGALRAFGVALLDPEATAEVEVDVVVGEDGFPRSIRRVQPVPAGHQQESVK